MKRSVKFSMSSSGHGSRTVYPLLASLILFSMLQGENVLHFADLSLEELMEETVTSVSKWEERRIDAAAAIALLNDGEILRTGALTIPDALRIVPGVNVASINSSDYAVSIRGFNSTFANKLLVLVDGRTIYTPSFGGVYWDMQSQILGDLDRIEVIRGPGATVWGANAVNGVINIVSKSSRDTQGGYLMGGAGNLYDYFSGARYGGQIGENTYYRVYASSKLHEGFPLDAAGDVVDGFETQTIGYRIDNYRADNSQMTLQGDYTNLSAEERGLSSYNLNTLGRWSKELADGSKISLQAYFDRTNRHNPLRVGSSVDMFDVSLEHSVLFGDHTKLIWGMGFRTIKTDSEVLNPFVSIIDESFKENLFSAFVQNEWNIIPEKILLTAGFKLEHNEYTGIEVQPSVRAVFKLSKNQALWASISRALRMPSQTENRDWIMLNLDFDSGSNSPAYVLLGQETVEPEQLIAYEMGYRNQIGKKLSMDLTFFYQDYTNLISSQTYDEATPVENNPRVMAVYWTNAYSGSNYGAEVAFDYIPIEALHFRVNYSLLRSELTGPRGGPISVRDFEESTPQQQANLMMTWKINKQWETTGQIRYVGSSDGVSGYMEADLQWIWKASETLEFILTGSNLLHSQHAEHKRNAPSTLMSEVARSIYLKAQVRF